MAERAGVSASTVGRIWRTFGLQPHIVESFKISDDPLFIEKVRDIVGLYLNPPDHACSEHTCRGNPCGCPVRQPEQPRAAGCNVDPQISTRIGGFQRETAECSGAFTTGS